MIVAILAWPHETLSDSGQTARSSYKSIAFVIEYDPWLDRTMPRILPVPMTPSHLPKAGDRPASRMAAVPTPPGRARVERVLVGHYGSGQCVALVRAKSGLEIAGNARDWPTLAKKAGYRVDMRPGTGSVIVTTESSVGTNTGHVLYQTGPADDGWLPVIEQNYISRTVTTGWIAASSPVIVAFIHST